MLHKSLNTHGTLSVYLLCGFLTVNCFQKNRFGEIVNSGSQSNSKVQSTLSASSFKRILSVLGFGDTIHKDACNPS